MAWQEVYILGKYYQGKYLCVNRNRYKLALIVYHKSDLSPNWLPFGYCSSGPYGPSRDLAAYGHKMNYDSGEYTMLKNWCNSRTRNKDEIECKCHYNEGFNTFFEGGPILNDDN